MDSYSIEKLVNQIESIKTILETYDENEWEIVRKNKIENNEVFKLRAYNFQELKEEKRHLQEERRQLQEERRQLQAKENLILKKS